MSEYSKQAQIGRVSVLSHYHFLPPINISLLIHYHLHIIIITHINITHIISYYYY